jgi:hypothetical protein
MKLPKGCKCTFDEINSRGGCECEALSCTPESAGWVSELSEKELRMLKKGLKQLKYTGLEAMTAQIELDRKLVKELSRRKKPNRGLARINSTYDRIKGD